MIPDRLLLTPDGEASLMSAEQGGVFIRPASFKVGNFSGTEPAVVAQDILGTILFQGQLFYVEVLNGKTARFTIEIPNTPDTISITEAMIFLEDGTALGRVRTAVPYEKHSNRKIRLSFMLHLNTDIAHLIDVTLSTFGSIPAVPSIDFLPAASTAIANSILVLDAKLNPDGEYSPELTYRFGAGGGVWGFGGNERLFSGQVTVIDPANFTENDTVDAFELQSDDEVICSVSVGKGAGETRRFKIINGNFVAKNLGFSDLDGTSIIHIWRQIGGVGGSSSVGGSGLPDRAGVGADWVLVAGDQTNSPYWSPIAPGRNRTRGNIFNPSGKLKITPISLTPTKSQKTFNLYAEDPLASADPESWIHRYSYRKNSNYSIVSLSGVCQHRPSFDLFNNRLEFSEDIPLGVTIDTRLFELEPHAGSRVSVVSMRFIGDGVTREFDLPAIPEDSTKVLTYFERALTIPSAYNIDLATGKIVFLEAVPTGLRFETNVFIHEDVENFATLVHTYRIVVKDRANVFVLPFTPSSKEQVFINVSGVHMYKDEYVLVGNKIILNSDITQEVPIEFMIFENVRSEGTSDTALRGMVVDAVRTFKGIELIRSGSDSLKIELPDIKLIQGKNCKIAGSFPEYEISFDAGDKDNTGYGAISITETGENQAEISITHRIEVKRDLILNVNAHFEAQLGPGFSSTTGQEEMQFSLGIKTLNSNEPDFGRQLKGTGTAGFGVSSPTASGKTAFSNGSVGDALTLIAKNNPQGYVEIVAKMRVINAKVGDYNSNIRISLNGIVMPILS